MTFPRKISDCPGHSSFPGNDGVSRYLETIHVGYRGFGGIDKPLYPIGFGLSYNTFSISPEAPSQTEGTYVHDESIPPPLSQTEVRYAHAFTLPLYLPVRVRNTGGLALAGRETLIAWARALGHTGLTVWTAPIMPNEWICAFAKTKPLLPGEETITTLTLDPRSLGIWNEEIGSWILHAGLYEIILRTNASNARHALFVTVPETVTWLR